MKLLKKLIAVGFSVVGLMFILAGVGLITFTQSFLLYSGVFLLVLSIIFFIQRDGKKEGQDRKQPEEEE